MTRITKPLRNRKPNKRLDVSLMREALRDRRTWTRLGVVRAPEGGGEHWRVVGENADIVIEVELQPTSELVEARLHGGGFWMVPAIGEEVAVLLPEGEITWMPMIVGIMSHWLPVAGDQAPSPTRIVIARGPGTQVLIHDGTGGAKELAYKSDVEAVDAKYDDHKHMASGSPTSGPLAGGVGTAPGVGGPGVGAILNPPNPNIALDPAHPFLSIPDLTPTADEYSVGVAPADALIVGTSVLKAK